MSPDISRLGVSESWKRTFLLIEKAGGPDLPQLKDLKFGERLAINFKLLAFLFGPFYYLAKGLWKQALLFLLLVIGIILLLDSVGMEKLSKGIGYGFAAVYSIRANVSYYRKVVLGVTPWF